MRRPPLLNRDNLGFLLAKATQRWNEMLHAGFTREGFGHVRPSYGAILVPLYEEDGLRLGDLAKRARLSKQTMTTMVRLLEREKLVRRRRDEEDARATRVFLSAHAHAFRPAAERVLARLEDEVGKEGSAEEQAIVRAFLRRFAGL